jgi:Co/Zn/Cd efflux system component
MLTDVAALVCGYWVAQLSMKDSTPKMSFGWKRAEIVGALCNGSLSVSLSLSIYIYIYIYVFLPPNFLTVPSSTRL